MFCGANCDPFEKVPFCSISVSPMDGISPLIFEIEVLNRLILRIISKRE